MDHRGDNPAADARFADGRALHRQGRLAEAETQYRAALASDNLHSDALEWLGVLCLQTGRIDEAVRLLGLAAERHPEKAAYHDNLAAALLQAQRPQEAAAAWRRSLDVVPDAIGTRVNLGTLLGRLGRSGEAMVHFAHAVAADPHLKAVCREPKALSSEEERCRTVLENCRHILARYPNYAPAQYSMACSLLNLGRSAEARQACERAIALDPTVPVYYHILVHGGDAEQKAAAVAALERLAGQEAALPEDGRAMLHFLLARAYDDQRRYGEAFAHLQHANAIKRGRVVYDEARELDRLSAIAAAFPSARLQADGSGATSDAPVFVLGMPRSGTSLIEQILACHPDVYGAGERTLLGDLVAGDHDAVPAADMHDVEDWRRLGEAYAHQLARIGAGAKRVVDKQPFNFKLIGCIRLALPQARIIHVRRDPRDTCFSCYGLMFAGEIGFAYDLAELGRYYRAYEALMAHWRAALPEGVMLEVRYEDLVDDLESQARRMLAYCGLEWDVRCLDFHKAERAVATASLMQIRQPLYRSAIGRWRPYEMHLAPLIEALHAEHSA